MSTANEVKKNAIKDRIMALAAENPGGVTYAQMLEIDEFAGDCQLAHPKFRHLLFWQGLSESAAEAVVELVRDGAIIHVPVDQLAYVAQGVSLDLPLFTSELALKAEKLDSDHWLPVMIIAS